MRKTKKLAAALAALMMLSMAGCNEDKESSNAGTVDSKKSSSSSDNSSKDSSDETSKAKETEKEEKNWFDWEGVKLYCPSNFKFENKLTDGWFYDGTMSTKDTIYYNAVPYITYTVDYGVDSFEPKDVPEIVGKFIYRNVNEFFPCYESKFSCSVESEKECKLLERPFIRRTGIIHTEKEDVKADLYYAAYYGVMKFPSWDYEKVPACWIAFADAKNEATKKDIEKLVDTAAEQLEFLK